MRAAPRPILEPLVIWELCGTVCHREPTQSLAARFAAYGPTKLNAGYGFYRRTLRIKATALHE